MAECRLEQSGRVLVVYLSGEIDHHEAARLRGQIDPRILSGDFARVVLDFSGVTFMDSSGIGVLLNRYKQMAGSGGSVVLYGAGTQVRRILHVGGLARLVPCFETKEAALSC